jgi:hypothetical protein
VSWWWLTFRDQPAKGDARNLGTLIVQGGSLESATDNARHLKLHPGGNAEGFEIPADRMVPEGWRNRLLSEQNAKALVAWSNRMWGKA